MAISPAGSRWGKNVLGFLRMAPRLARTTLRTWIFATTKTDGHAARSAVAVKFALTTATDRFARSVVGGAFVITTANGRGARIAEEAAFALTIAYGTAAQSASLKLGSKKIYMRINGMHTACAHFDMCGFNLPFGAQG